MWAIKSYQLYIWLWTRMFYYFLSPSWNPWPSARGCEENKRGCESWWAGGRETSTDITLPFEIFGAFHSFFFWKGFQELRISLLCLCHKYTTSLEKRWIWFSLSGKIFSVLKNSLYSCLNLQQPPFLFTAFLLFPSILSLFWPSTSSVLVWNLWEKKKDWTTFKGHSQSEEHAFHRDSLLFVFPQKLLNATKAEKKRHTFPVAV